MQTSLFRLTDFSPASVNLAAPRQLSGASLHPDSFTCAVLSTGKGVVP